MLVCLLLLYRIAVLRCSESLYCLENNHLTPPFCNIKANIDITVQLKQPNQLTPFVCAITHISFFAVYTLVNHHACAKDCPCKIKTDESETAMHIPRIFVLSDGISDCLKTDL